MGRPFDPELVLALPLMANLATISPEGPRNAPVWFIWERDALWMLGHAAGSSVRRLDRDPRCAVEIVHYDNAEGILAHLGLRGRATVEPMAPPLFRRLLAKYLDADPGRWNRWFVDIVARPDDPDGRLIRLAPETILTNNVSYFRTGPLLAWPGRT